MQTVINPETIDKVRFCHFEFQCRTHGADCNIRYPNLQLRKNPNGDTLFYYRPPSAMRYGLLTQRLIESFSSHDIYVIPIVGCNKVKTMRLIEDRGLLDQEVDSRTIRPRREPSRSRSRSRSRSNTRLESIRARTDEPEVNVSTIITPYLENRLGELEKYMKESRVKQEEFDEKLDIQKEEIELCKVEIETHDDQIKHCFKTIKQNTEDISDLRKNLANHKSSVNEKIERWEEFRRKHLVDVRAAETLMKKVSHQPVPFPIRNVYQQVFPPGFQGVSGVRQSTIDRIAVKDDATTNCSFGVKYQGGH